jgi:hypothetical protein
MLKHEWPDEVDMCGYSWDDFSGYRTGHVCRLDQGHKDEHRCICGAFIKEGFRYV